MVERTENQRSGPDCVTLDLRGLKCPLPAMRTEAAVNRLAKGQKIEVLTTDPMSAIDVPHAARKSGGRVLRESRNGDVLVFEIARED